MKLQIQIADDAELRAFVKEQIRGAIKAVTREEILKLIVDEIGGKAKGSTSPHLTALLNTEVSTQVRAKLNDGNYWGSEGMLTKIVRQEVKDGLSAHFKKAGI